MHMLHGRTSVQHANALGSVPVHSLRDREDSVLGPAHQGRKLWWRADIRQGCEAAAHMQASRVPFIHHTKVLIGRHTSAAPPRFVHIIVAMLTY